MSKLFLSGACALLAAGFLVSVSPALADQPAVPVGPLNMNLTKKPVIFDHADHQQQKCGDCHHKVDGKENYQKCATAGCHDVLGNKDKSVHSYYRIAHDRKVTEIQSCLSCHVEVAKAKPDMKKALTSCVGSSCHPKN